MSAVAALPKGPPRTGERLPASFGLSLAMHLLLFAALAFVVRWNVAPQGMVVAELWGVPARVEPPPEAVAPPAPPSEPAPAPAKPEVDIALEQEKKRRAAEQAQREAEKKRQAEEAARKQAEAEKKKRAAADAEKQRQAAAQREQEQREAVKVEAIRRQQTERLLAQAGGSGAPGTVAAGARGSADAGYAGAVIACIRPHIAFAVPDNIKPGQYRVEYVVHLLPSGEQVGAPRLDKASGLAGFDSAVERAIRRCDPFPRKKDGTVDRVVTVAVDPVDAR